ncbi:hypothetical protein MTP99_015730 [Tenebrio molitor]|uniref:Uncharacterized protein n=1 Tax=Tenebrio molitor TaxID=7067 RepID=A0A8J6LKF5_TENMO|nr:hypothetical protein GEV33_000528 [Tenebrio molitor]KAJ3628426.1 hypothetical protein MTP99_015730 [Tenebrio molitor]
MKIVPSVCGDCGSFFPLSGDDVLVIRERSKSTILVSVSLDLSREESPIHGSDLTSILPGGNLLEKLDPTWNPITPLHLHTPNAHPPLSIFSPLVSLLGHTPKILRLERANAFRKELLAENARIGTECSSWSW